MISEQTGKMPQCKLNFNMFLPYFEIFFNNGLMMFCANRELYSCQS